MDALEDLREGFATLEVQTAVVGGLRQATSPVVDADQVLVRLGGGPTGADRQRGVELAFDLTDVEGHAERRSRERGSETDGQWQFCQAPERCGCCHRRYSMCFLLLMLADYSQQVLALDPSKV
ncbi:hypothetical protein D9M71_568660 [compost metagenome]